MSYLNIHELLFGKGEAENGQNIEIIIINKSMSDDVMVTKTSTKNTLKIRSDGSYKSISIFVINRTSYNKLILLCSGQIYYNDLDKNKVYPVILNRPVNSLNEQINITDVGITSYIDERLFNYDYILNTNPNIVKVSITNKNIYPISNTKIIKKKIDETYLYDRYSNNIIKEYNSIGTRLSDRNLSNITSNKNIIKVSNERILNLMPYDNNQIISPVDGRIRGFIINPTLHITLYSDMSSQKYLVSKFINDKPLFELNNSNNFNNGFSMRVTRQDNKNVIVPYGGILTDVSEGSNTIIFRFETSYFISRDINERDYWSSITGWFNSGNGMGNRYWPEYLNPQRKDDHLKYYVIISNPYGSNYISNRNIKSSSYDKGEKLCYVENGGIVTVLFNRNIKFSKDIEHYSKFRNGIECRIVRGDDLGTIM